MSKILKSSTIISPDLYIKRDADRQLARIINDMGRPGYILVSRQMGKTNLLINAKREIESDTCIFVYVDLSNKFDTSRECFRNIIDTAIDTNSNIFGIVSKKISELRISSTHMSAHKEHESELLLLLRTFRGKIVVVLDEIDALVNTEYSDQFFSQIRSIYFTRINFDEYNRLTYILSGVVEPSSIIKDKNRSPFNIGEKIFLDDFTYVEHCLFLGKINEEVKNICSEKIFEWTNGHPRMTWDVCSAIEDIFIENNSIVVDDVDLAVKKLYLENFDKAPVDHIRDLVQKNIEIRRAVRDILNGDISIKENIKRKLYLSGIIKSDIASNDVELKNNIIRESLSLTWLTSIDRANIDLLSIINEQKVLGNYTDAIKYFNEYVKDFGTDDVDLSNSIYYDIGFCYAKKFEFENALIHFSKCLFDKNTNSTNYYNNVLDIGLCNFNLNDYNNAICKFKEIISDSNPCIVRVKASLNYAVSLTRIDFESNKNESLNIYHEILNEIECFNFIDIDELSEIKVLCYYNIGFISSFNGDIQSACINYRKAMDCNVQKFLPGIYLCLLKIEKDDTVLLDLIKRSVRSIVDNKIEPIKGSADNTIEFSVYVLADILTHSFIVSDKSYYEELSEYCRLKIFTDYNNSYEFLLGLASLAKNSGNYSESTMMYEQVLNEILVLPESNIKSDNLIEIYRSLIINKWHCKKNFNDYYLKYVELFIMLSPCITESDLKVFTANILYLRNENKFSEALKSLDIILQSYNFEKNDLKQSYIGLLFLKSQINDSINNKKVSYLAACEVLRILNEYDKSISNSISMQDFDYISIESKKLVSKNSFHEQIFKNKVGRNELCPCGSGLKYKKCCYK